MPSNPVKVQVPLLFSLRHRTHSPHKTSYLLGTLHVLPLSVLPDQSMTVIKSCSSFVTEESDDDALEYYTEAILRDENSEDWFSKLSSEIADVVAKTVDKSFEYADPSLKQPAQALTLWAAYQQAFQGFMMILSEKQSEASHDDDQQLLGMDHTLWSKLFPENPKGLENSMEKIPRFKQEANTIEAFNELFEAWTTCLSTEEQNNNPEKQSNELEDIITDYYNGGLFYNHQYAKEENEERDTIARNIQWIPNIAKHHSELPGPVLFGVGACHLMGEQGLLALLPKHGFEIGRLKPDGSFQAYVYPFQSDYIAKTALAREHFMLRFTSTSNSKASCPLSKGGRPAEGGRGDFSNGQRALLLKP